MKRKRYLVEQIVAAVKQHEQGTPAADISRKLDIAERIATYSCGTPSTKPLSGD